MRLERGVGVVQVVCWGGLSGRGKRTYKGRGRWINKITRESMVRWRWEGNKAGEWAETSSQGLYHIAFEEFVLVSSFGGSVDIRLKKGYNNISYGPPIPESSCQPSPSSTNQKLCPEFHESAFFFFFKQGPQVIVMPAKDRYDCIRKPLGDYGYSSDRS